MSIVGLTRGTETPFYGIDGVYSENAASLLSHISLGRPAETREIACRSSSRFRRKRVISMERS